MKKVLFHTRCFLSICYLVSACFGLFNIHVISSSIESFRRVQQITPVQKLQIFAPAGIDFGLRQMGVEIIKPLVGEVDRSVLNKPGMELLPSIISAAITARFMVGEGKDVADVKAVFTKVKGDIDYSAVRAAQNQLIEICKTYGLIIVLEGEEGPGRDQSAGAEPGTIFTAKGMYLPSYYQTEEFCRGEGERFIPRNIKEVLDLAEWGGIGLKRSEIKGVVFLKFDTVENTNATALGTEHGWSFVSVRMFSFSDGVTPPDLLTVPAHYTPDGYIGGWTFTAPRTVKVRPYELPSSAVPKIAEAYGETVEEYLSKTIFVVLDRSRHKTIIEDLKNLGASYVLIKDGDMPMRVLSLLGDLSGKRIVVLGASGACEFSAAMNAAIALRSQGAQFYSIQTTTNNTLLKDVTEWGLSPSFTREELREFEDLNIPRRFYEEGMSIDTMVISPHESRLVFLVPITGAPKELFGNIANLFPEIKIVPEGDGAIIEVPVLVVMDEGGKGEGKVFVLRTSYSTDNLERTKILMLYIDKAGLPILDEPPR